MIITITGTLKIKESRMFANPQPRSASFNERGAESFPPLPPKVFGCFDGYKQGSWLDGREGSTIGWLADRAGNVWPGIRPARPRC